MRIKGKFILAALCLVLFLTLIVLVRTVDVHPAGRAGGEIGLASVNGTVFEQFGENEALYKITEVLGIAAIAVMALFAALGVVQIIKRRSLLKVDREIVALGVLYAAVIALYAFFEFVIVNYRPIIEEGASAPEASFPSSHTMLVFVVMGSAALVIGKYIKIEWLRTALRIACVAVIAVTVAGRLISGVHWFTDIVGGIFISSALLFTFSAALDMIEEKEQL
ncbi:MAG: phosphatase PAP2 family protein [Clostridia bacterium]|nr:phosphatase PAP2 family protein [Clostridia bacterium]